MERIIMHIDVNNAFLSWTAVDMLKKGAKVDIRNTYAVVGGSKDKRHGMVLAKSTPCKKLGVKTGEPYFMARKKCRNFKIYEPDYVLYQKMSKSLFKLLSNYSPDIETFSIDECFLDYTKVKKLHGNPILFAKKIQMEIYNKLGFTVNIGIGNNKLCAKMASDFEKPFKIHTLWASEIESKMHPLPVGDLFGVGKKSAERLRTLGINTIGDLANFDDMTLRIHFKNSYIKYKRIANGLDSGEVTPNIDDPKGISISRTFSRDYENKEEIIFVIKSMAHEVSTSLRKRGKYVRVISVNLRDKFFRNYSHQIKLKNATDSYSEIEKIAIDLFNNAWDGKPLRLIGVSLSDLSNENNYQVSLFDNIEEKDTESEIDKIIDEVSTKYGKGALKRASLINKKIKKKY